MPRPSPWRSLGNSSGTSAPETTITIAKPVPRTRLTSMIVAIVGAKARASVGAPSSIRPAARTQR
nr:hypothetical protein [Fodinicola feengrottensis]